VWSATSYNLLYRDAVACQRWNRLHADASPRVPFIAQALQAEPWPVVAVSDYISSVAQRIAPWTPAGLSVLGTDGFGRSDTRPALRRHFQIDAEHIVLAALTSLAARGQFDAAKLPRVAADLGIDADAPDPQAA
jgi:pyruvate dehydrogenase E1 component